MNDQRSTPSTASRIREVLVAAVAAAVAGVVGGWLSSLRGGDEAAASAPAQAAVGASASPGSSWIAPHPGGASAWARPSGAVRATVTVTVTNRIEEAAGASLEVYSLAVPSAANRGSEYLPLGKTTLDEHATAELELYPGQYQVVLRAKRGRADQSFAVVEGHDQELLLTLEPTWAAHLRVVEDETRRAIPNAEVTLRARVGTAVQRTPPQTTRTDGFGKALLEDLPQGAVAVRVTAAGYVEAHAELAADAVDEQEIVLEVGGFITGRVIDENGTVLPKVRVATPDGAEELTDVAGQFRIGSTPGDVVLAAVDPAGRSATTRVQLMPGQTVSGVELKLGAPRHLSGVVLDGVTLQPVAGVPVEASTGVARAKVVVARTTTGDQGTFDIDGLPQGWVTLTARLGRGARGEAPGVMTDSTEKVTLTLSPPAAVVGVVTDGQQRPVRGATVALTHGGIDEPTMSAVTDDEGGYRLDDVLPGAVSVRAFVGERHSSMEKAAQLSGGAAERADLVIEEHGIVEGRVNGTDGRPVTLTAFNEELRVGERFPVAPDGRFSIQLLARRWHLGAHFGGLHVKYDDTVVEVVAGQVVHQDLEVKQVDKEEMRTSFGVEAGTLGASYSNESDGKVTISWVTVRGPAAKAGLAVGDVLVAIDGAEVHSSLEAFEKTRGNPGSRVSLTVRGTAGERVVALDRQPAFGVSDRRVPHP